MKKLLNLKGVKALNKKQQKEIFGGDDFTHAPPQDGGGGGDGGGSSVYCGCTHGDNIWASACNYYVCEDACNSNGNGSWTGACMV